MYWVHQMKRWERLLEQNEEFLVKETGLSKRKLREVLEVLYEYRMVD